MSNNLFIVGTPYHLMTAFIISNSLYKNDNNYLALLHPHGYDKWNDTKVMKFMSSTDCGYKKVFPLIKWMTKKEKNLTYKQQVDYVKNEIGVLNIENVFLGCDSDVQNQILVSAIGLEKFYRYEDGMFSYYNEDRKRNFWHKNFHKLKIKIIQLLSGINSSMPINTLVSGASDAGIGDFFYKPELVKVPSPCIYEITGEMINSGMRILEKNNLIKQSLFDSKYVMYLSQPVTEQGKIDFDTEIKCIQTIVKNLNENEKLIYKPHPNDKEYKVQYIKEKFPEIIINESKIPVEVFLYQEPMITRIISYQSTTLLIADKFVGRSIECSSLVNYYKKPLDSAYVDLMKMAGVKFL